MLFVADAPMSVSALAQASGLTEGQIEQALEIFEAKLAESGPLQIVKLAGGYQIATRPEFAGVIGNLLKPQRQRLSKSLLEVLAVIAYKQPITLAEIDHVRGVQSDYSVRQLLERRLIREVGRRSTPGRPTLFGTTPQFLHQFKMQSLEDLPELDHDSAQALPVKGALSLFDDEHS